MKFFSDQGIHPTNHAENLQVEILLEIFHEWFSNKHFYLWANYDYIAMK
jgi:hypothetical protein